MDSFKKIMLKYSIWALLLFFCLIKPVYGVQFIVPHQVGGFVLGEPIEKFKDIVDLNSRMNVRYREYLYEVETKPQQHFKSGLIAVGNCADPGKIIRIKLTYADSSKAFYNELLNRCKARFGAPTESKGDPFRIFIVWKWHFIDEHQNQINLVLQHNIEDENEKGGNCVKLIFINQVEKEETCFLEKKRQTDTLKKDDDIEKSPVLIPDWDLLIPK
jgi:hypothetical protein